MLKTIKHLLLPPVFPGDEEKTRIARTVHTLFLGLVFVSIASILVDKQRTTTVILLVGNSVNITAYILNRLRLPRVAGFILLLVFLTAVTALMLVGNGIHDVAITGLPVLMIMSALVLERRGVIAFAILTIASAGLVTYAGMGGIPGIHIRTPEHTYVLEFIIVALILGIASLSSHILIEQLIKGLIKARITEAQILSIVENSPDLIVKIDRTGVILLANYHPERFQGNRLQDFVLPGDDVKVTESLAEAFETGKGVTLEVQIKEMDGTFQWNSVRFGPVKSGGKVPSVVAIITNIHAQQEAALQIRQSADRLTVLNEIGRASTVLTDLDSVLETIHQQVERVVPLDVFFVALYDPETNMVSYPLVYDHGRRWQEPDTELVPEAYSSQVLQTGKSIMVLASPEEMERDRQQGAAIRIGDYDEVSASMIYVPMFIKGRIIGTLSAQSYTLNAYTQDHLKLLEGVANQVAISIENARLFEALQGELQERIRTEDALRVSENLFRAAFYASPLPFCLTELESGRHIDANEAYLELLHFTREQVIGHTTVELNQWASNEERAPFVERLKTLRRIRNQEDMVTTQSGEKRNVLMSYDLLLINGELRILSLFEDITERKRAEEMREKLIRELEQRNAELERLAYTLSHELKSPLITISGFVSYLRQDALNNDTERLDADINRITDAVDKMRRLTNELIELMSVGRIVNEFAELPLRAVVDEALVLVHEKIEEKNISIQIANDLPRVYGDHKRLLEVFQNLLENAAKFIGEQPEPKIEIGQRREVDGQPVLFVRDNGIGIDPRFSNRVFGIFQKLDAQSDGTGIGLALVKRIIEVHGGRIWVESDGWGKGSTFCFTIPDSRK